MGRAFKIKVFEGDTSHFTQLMNRKAQVEIEWNVFRADFIEDGPSAKFVAELSERITLALQPQ